MLLLQEQLVPSRHPQTGAENKEGESCVIYPHL